ncbi:MAG: hydrogenase maturation protease [bacterium]
MLVIGAGNELRRDDAAGLETARRLVGVAGVDVREARGDMTSLPELWDDTDRVVIVDAARSGAPAGTVHRFDATSTPLPATFGRGSTHALGVADAVEFARALGRLPATLIVYGIEGENFHAGEGLSAAVARAVDDAVARIGAEIPRA